MAASNKIIMVVVDVTYYALSHVTYALFDVGQCLEMIVCCTLVLCDKPSMYSPIQ